MPKTPTAAELVIPPASIAAWCEGPDINCGNDEHDIRAVAAPVVAAELRRIAALLDETDDARKLLARANELDPPARQEA